MLTVLLCSLNTQSKMEISMNEDLSQLLTCRTIANSFVKESFVKEMSFLGRKYVTNNVNYTLK